MYFPVGILKALSIVSQIDPLVLTKLVDMPPLNITQEYSAHLLFPKINYTGEYWIISKPTIWHQQTIIGFYFFPYQGRQYFFGPFQGG